LVIKLVVVVVVVVDIADIWKRVTILNTQLSAYSSFVRYLFIVTMAPILNTIKYPIKITERQIHDCYRAAAAA